MSRKVYQIFIGNEEILDKVNNHYGGLTNTMLDELWSTNKGAITKSLKDVASHFTDELITLNIIKDDKIDLELYVSHEDLLYCSKCEELHNVGDPCYC